MRFYEATAKALADSGVTTMFGQIGDANLYMVDSYVRDQGCRYVGAVHESGAVLMALGFAHRSGGIGVVTTTHGPAVTNTITAVVEAVRDAVPIVLVVGDTPATRLDHPQAIGQRELFTAAGAGFMHVGAPTVIQRDIAVALRRARAERRPVALSFPTEFTWQEVEYGPVPDHTAVVPRTRPDARELDDALGIVASARRPVVLLGHGVDAAGRSTVLRLAERIGAPVATTLKAKGSVGPEAFALGVFGTFSTDVATEVFLDADCIVAFGASLNRFTTAMGSLTKDTAVVHCDADPAAIGRYMTPNSAVVGDAGATAQAMLELIEASDLAPSGFRERVVDSRRDTFDDIPDYVDCSTDRTVDIRTALRWINRAVPSRRTVVTDGGRCIGQAIRFVDVADPSAWIYTLGFASIGLGAGTAIGAAVAASDEPVLFIAGDGGFMSGGLNEFNTAVRENLDLIAVICNDGAYGAEHAHFRNHDLDPALSTFDWPDLAPVADALGGRGTTVRNLEDLNDAERAIHERDRPLLIDVKLDPDNVPPLL